MKNLARDRSIFADVEWPLPGQQPKRYSNLERAFIFASLVAAVSAAAFVANFFL